MIAPGKYASREWMGTPVVTGSGAVASPSFWTLKLIVPVAWVSVMTSVQLPATPDGPVVTVPLEASALE